MKAVRVRAFGGPEVLQVEEVPLLEVHENEVLIEVRACGVNPVDTYIRSGTYASKPSLPYTPGFDASGVVVAKGTKVMRFSAGERVYTIGTISGAYAEYTVCRENQVFPLPEKLSFAQGAALGIPYTTAYRALFQKACARSGETVLIHGATGSVGLAALQLAKAYGLKVIGTGGTEEGRKLLREQGADEVFDHTADGDREKMRSRYADGVDIILEMLANENLDRDLSLASRFGRIVIIGCRGSATIHPREAMRKEVTVLGMSVFHIREQEMEEIQARLYQGLESGKLNPVIRMALPLQEASLAHKLIMERGAQGKMVLVPERGKT